MRTKTDITIDGYTYRDPELEVESFSVNKSEYLKSSNVTADIYIKEPSTGRDTMVTMDIQVEQTTIESVEAAALASLTPGK